MGEGQPTPAEKDQRRIDGGMYFDDEYDEGWRPKVKVGSDKTGDGEKNTEGDFSEGLQGKFPNFDDRDQTEKKDAT